MSFLDDLEQWSLEKSWDSSIVFKDLQISPKVAQWIFFCVCRNLVNTSWNFFEGCLVVGWGRVPGILLEPLEVVPPY